MFFGQGAQLGAHGKNEKLVITFSPLYKYNTHFLWISDQKRTERLLQGNIEGGQRDKIVGLNIKKCQREMQVAASNIFQSTGEDKQYFTG